MIMIHLKTSSYFSAAHTGAEDTVDSVVMTEITVLMQGKGKNKQSLDRWIWADDILEESDNTCRITNRNTDASSQITSSKDGSKTNTSYATRVTGTAA